MTRDVPIRDGDVAECDDNWLDLRNDDDDDNDFWVGDHESAFSDEDVLLILVRAW